MYDVHNRTCVAVVESVLKCVAGMYDYSYMGCTISDMYDVI